MIILVAVTLNIALGENGLIAKAKETRTKQEEQTIYEDIQGMMELDNNGEINVGKTFGNVVEKYTPEKVTPNTIAEGAESIEFTVQGEYGTYKYKITKNEITSGKKIKKSNLKFFMDKNTMSGVLIKDNNEVIATLNGEKSAMKISEGYLKEKAEVKICEETKIYEKAIYMKIIPKNYKQLYGYIKDNKFIFINATYSKEDENIDSQTKEIINYDSISEEKAWEQAQYPGENILDGDMYSKAMPEGTQYIIINENKNRIAEGFMEDSIFYPLSEVECIIKENYLVVLDDGSTIDYSGKKAVFIFIDESFQFYGYIDNNKFVYVDARISEKEEFDGKIMPKTYESIKETEILELN